MRPEFARPVAAEVFARLVLRAAGARPNRQRFSALSAEPSPFTIVGLAIRAAHRGIATSFDLRFVEYRDSVVELIDAVDCCPRSSPRARNSIWTYGETPPCGGSDEAESIKTIQAAIDREITLIDTARVYGFGRSEEIVGKALKQGGSRNRVVIATKAGLDWRAGHPELTVVGDPGPQFALTARSTVLR